MPPHVQCSERLLLRKTANQGVFDSRGHRVGKLRMMVDDDRRDSVLIDSSEDVPGSSRRDVKALEEGSRRITQSGQKVNFGKVRGCQRVRASRVRLQQRNELP